jgi:predicted NUDIX family phosphoesterase
MKHQEHIVCVKSSIFENEKNDIVDYQLKSTDLMLGSRISLEGDIGFRQVMPMLLLKFGDKIWAYKRTPKSGEEALFNRTAVFVGGHWDINDLVYGNDSIIDVEKSFLIAQERELAEEVSLGSKIVGQSRMPYVICANDELVDRKHLCVITIVELDGMQVTPQEDKLLSVGFKTPEELLLGDYNLETWARIACQILIDSKN